MAEQQRFATSIGASVLLHLLILLALFAYVTSPHKPISVPTVDVDLSSIPLPAPKPPPGPPVPAPPDAKAMPAPPPMAVPQRQVVAPPDAGEEKEPPPDTRLLSDRNNVVPEEMVRKGDGGTDEKATEQLFKRQEEKPPPAKVEPQKPPQQAAPPKPKEEPKQIAKAAPPPPPMPRDRPKPAARPVPGDGGERLAALPSLDKLLPSAADLARNAPLPEATPQQQASRSGRDLLNSGGDVFSGRPGTRDYLPRVREGNVTMLNTKADLFAPFVRRVAGRVFENLDLAFSQLRNRRGMGRGRATATVEAIMDRNGRFVSATLTENGGLNTIGVDRLLLSSATPDTFFDANPPSGAEAVDGKIHFILLVDLMVDSAPDPRTGREAVSYYGVAGVGLK